MQYVPATPAGGFQWDGTSTNKSVITTGYWMGETEVTQGLFEAVMGSGVRPSNFTSNPEDGGVDGWKKLPVEQVSWYAAIAFCNKLSILDGKTPVYSVTSVSDWGILPYGSIPTINNVTWNAVTINALADGYRLPTEMEWMWAAMGATAGGATVATTGYNKGYAGSTEAGAAQASIGNYAWYATNSNNKTHEVGKKTVNELGIFDMSGNVFEWCWDGYGPYPSGTKIDYTGAAPGVFQVIQGGNYSYLPSYCRVASRVSGGNPYTGSFNIGFRVVCP
jgi:formylglycine-generating enzyme required for sulfatase activity